MRVTCPIPFGIFSRADNGIEGARAHESGAPEAAELSQLLIQGHEVEQVLDALLNRSIRVSVERSGHGYTPCIGVKLAGLHRELAGLR